MKFHENKYKDTFNKIKMCDESKQRLKELYTELEVEDEENSVIQLPKMKYFRPIDVTAACLAFLIAIGGVLNIGNIKGSTVNSGSMASSGNTLSSVELHKASNSYMLAANAAEITPEGTAVVNVAGGVGFSIGDGDEGETDYYIDFPVSCHGENIKSVSYLAKNARFDDHKLPNSEYKNIEFPEESAYEASSEICTITISDGKDEGSFVLSQSDEIIFEYPNDATYDDYTFRGTIMGSSQFLSEEDKEFLKANKDLIYNLDGKADLEEQKKVLERLIKDIEIECTINFEDGSQQKTKILLGCEIMKPSQVFKGDSTEEMPPEDEDKDALFITLRTAD